MFGGVRRSLILMRQTTDLIELSMLDEQPRGWREPRARASSADALLSVVFFLRARYIFASFVFIE